jgi:outer membrane protein OmpA-like peptidoglycan-associated protein
VVRVERNRIVILQQIQFATASDVIKPVSDRIVDEVAAALRDNPGIELVRIEGHTDNEGGVASNLDLSTRRAARVRQALIKRGIDARRLESKGYGQSRPIATNATPAGRQANRRVEFIIVKQAGG